MNIKYIVSTISFKIIVPIIFVFMIVMTVAFVRMNLRNKEFANHKSIVKTDNVIQQLNNDIRTAKNTAIYSSSIYSNLDITQTVYNNYQITGDLKSAHIKIKNRITKEILNTEKNLSFTPIIQFHIPPATSLYKSWSDNYGEDLSSKRNTILEINQSHKTLENIEVVDSKLIITGIAPIYDKNKEYCGSVETIFPLDNILDKLVVDKGTNFAIFINSNQLNTFENINYDKIGELSILRSSLGFIINNIKEEDFNSWNNEILHKSINNYTYAIEDISNNLGDKLGFIVVQIDVSENIAEINQQIIKNIIFAFIVISIVIMVVRWGIFSNVVRPIDTLAKDIELIARGELIDNIKNNKTGIIWTIYHSYNIMIDRLKATTEFANQIGEGNLNVNLDNIHKEDILGHSLIRMKNNLLEAKELEEKNKKEEEKRNWATKGFANFSEILRQTNKSIEEFSSDIIINLVKYTNSNQGGIFILNDNEKENVILELTASYAYNRKKYITKTINLGEGLVGLCAIEKETIFLTEIPENYIHITSGLGDSNPRSIVIIPLKLEDKIFGIIELASFSIYEDYQISFLEQLGESIASTLSIAKTNILTKELLEQSQQQQEEMAAQEEEMRQNLEEMQATQEAFLDPELASELRNELEETKKLLEDQRKEFSKKEAELQTEINNLKDSQS